MNEEQRKLQQWKHNYSLPDWVIVTLQSNGLQTLKEIGKTARLNGGKLVSVLKSSGHAIDQSLSQQLRQAMSGAEKEFCDNNPFQLAPNPQLVFLDFTTRSTSSSSLNQSHPFSSSFPIPTPPSPGHSYGMPSSSSSFAVSYGNMYPSQVSTPTAT